MKKYLFVISLACLPFAALGAALAQDTGILGATVTDSYVNPKGAFVNVVTPGGSIAKAGLLGGDVITTADGKPIANAASFEQVLAGHKPGDSIAVDAVHLGKPGHFTLVLTASGGAPAPMAANAPKSDAPRTIAPQPAPRTAAASATNVQWSEFADPSEHAFTMQVPAGWRVQGGTVRKNVIEIPMGVTATSPDGDITLFYGDPSVPTYSVPARITAMAGLRPGMTYNMGQGVTTVIEPYMDGATFAARWGVGRIARDCAQVRQMASRPRPDSTQGLNLAYAQIRTSVQAGEASFACSLRGKQAGGYVFAATELVQSPMGALWDVKYLVGAIAPANRAAEAYAILAGMAGSFAIDRGWMARQQQATGQFDQAVAQANAVVDQRIQENVRAAEQASQNMIDKMRKNSDANFNAIESRERNSNATSNAIDNYDAFAIRGTSDYVNPDTGTGFSNLDNSYAHSYVNNSGEVRQTNSENGPAAGEHELQQVPAGR